MQQCRIRSWPMYITRKQSQTSCQTGGKFHQKQTLRTFGTHTYVWRRMYTAHDGRSPMITGSNLIVFLERVARHGNVYARQIYRETDTVVKGQRDMLIPVPAELLIDETAHVLYQSTTAWVTRYEIPCHRLAVLSEGRPLDDTCHWVLSTSINQRSKLNMKTLRDCEKPTSFFPLPSSILPSIIHANMPEMPPSDIPLSR